ncbi:hypothetical protein [Mucilaginibacter antarcticus]|uniref:hypothetical protein n=1 Tax=Mucilaginibacter antarcticus TaxID=1855725 RepID=UPI00362B5A3D
MIQSDEDFREEFKPLHVPAHFLEVDTQENKIIFALAQSGEGVPIRLLQSWKSCNPVLKMSS